MIIKYLSKISASGKVQLDYSPSSRHPSATQGFIKLNDRYQMKTVRCHEREFGIE
jgi:hypothetical protein